MSLSARIGFAIALLALAPHARAADTKAACIAAAESGQDLRGEGKFTSARERFVECSQAACPDAIRKDCARFLDEIEASFPSIVITAVDDKGIDLGDARAFLDDKPTTLDGKAIRVDPGKHVVRIEPKSGASVQTELVVSEGEKNRKVVVTVGKPSAPPPSVAPEAPSTSIAPWIIGGAGLAVVGGSLYLGFAARHEISDLRSSCGPYCDSSEVDASKRKLLFADIGLGVGVIAIGVATYMLVSPSPAPSKTPAIGAAYVPSGAVVHWSSVF